MLRIHGQNVQAPWSGHHSPEALQAMGDQRRPTAHDHIQLFSLVNQTTDTQDIVTLFVYNVLVLITSWFG